MHKQYLAFALSVMLICGIHAEPVINPAHSGWTSLGATSVAGSLGLLTWQAQRKHRSLRRQLAHAKVDLEHGLTKEKASTEAKIRNLERQIALVKHRLHWYLGAPTSVLGALALASGGHAGYHYAFGKPAKKKHE